MIMNVQYSSYNLFTITITNEQWFCCYTVYRILVQYIQYKYSEVRTAFACSACESSYPCLNLLSSLQTRIAGPCESSPDRRSARGTALVAKREAWRTVCYRRSADNPCVSARLRCLALYTGETGRYITSQQIAFCEQLMKMPLSLKAFCNE